MSSIAVIRSQVERRIPRALTVYERQTQNCFRQGSRLSINKLGAFQRRVEADMRPQL